jgi:hypothetical protein
MLASWSCGRWRLQHGRRYRAAAGNGGESARKYGARVMVDDAHGIGVTGGGRVARRIISMSLMKSTSSWGPSAKALRRLAALSLATRRGGALYPASCPLADLLGGAACARTSWRHCTAAVEIIETEPEHNRRSCGRTPTICANALPKLGYDTGNEQLRQSCR